MADESPEPGHEVADETSGVRNRRIDPDSSTAEYDLLEIIAELEGCEIEALPPLYDEVEHVVETLFKTPPSQRAQMEISFSYAGYRVTLGRSGAVKVVPVKQSL